MSFFSRRFWNPILTLSGCLTMMSGFFLIFHFSGSFLLYVHKLASIIFAISAIVHIFMNFGALLKSLGNRASTWAILFFLLLSLVLMFLFAKRDDGWHRINRIMRMGEIDIMFVNTLQN